MARKKVWRLISLYTDHSGLSTKAEGMIYFSWSRYEVDKNGHLEYTGEHLSGAVSEDKLREMLKPHLKLERTELIWNRHHV